MIEQSTLHCTAISKQFPPLLVWQSEVFQALSEADYAIGELAGVCQTLSNPNLISNLYSNYKIFPWPSEIDKQANSIEIISFDCPLATQPKIRAYVQTAHIMFHRLKGQGITQQLLCALHQQLLSNEKEVSSIAGKLRSEQNWIGFPKTGLVEASFVPPPVSELQAHMDKLEEYINQKSMCPKVVKIGLAHYLFEFIHPFDDGNGRVGCLLIGLLLAYWNLLPQLFLDLRYYFERNRTFYYDVLEDVNRREGWNQWLIFFLSGITKEAKDTTKRARKLQILQNTWREQVANKFVSVSLSQLIESLFDCPILSIAQVQRMLSISKAAATGYIRELVNYKILTPYADSRTMDMYIAEDILRIILDSSTIESVVD